MKTLELTIALLALLHVGTASAQEPTVKLNVPGFARPLVEKWVQEYSKTAGDVHFQLSKGASGNDGERTVSFIATDGRPTVKTVLVGQYAVLPVVNRQSDAEQLLAGKALNAKKLKSLFFIKDEFADDQRESKVEKAVHIYSGNSRQSVSRAFAALFKEEPTQFKGKKISGDDLFLNTALSRDPLGVTINALPNIFDLQNRQLRQQLALVPLELDRQGRQVMDGGRLDDIIRLLEQQRFDAIPIGKIGIVYDKRDSGVSAFVQWILTHGVQYIHEYGLLQLSEKELTASIRLASQQDLAQK